MNDIEIESLVMQQLASFPLLVKDNVARPNVNFDPTKVKGVWFRINFKPITSAISSITSDPCVTDYGMVVIQVFDKPNVGTGNVKRYANALAKHLSLKRLGTNLDMLAATSLDIGDDGNGFYQINVNIPYQFYGNS